MSRILTGRSENAIKNRFNSLNAKGLAETRANELMAKLGPEEKAELMLRDVDRVPVTGVASSSRQQQRPPSRRPSSKPSISSPRYGDNDGRAREDAGNARFTSSRDTDRFGGGGGGGRIGNEDEGVSSAMASYGSGEYGSDYDDGDHRHHHHNHHYDARVGRSFSGVGASEDGGGGGATGGGSGALQALMDAAVVAGDDRTVDPGTDSHYGGGAEDETEDADDIGRPGGSWAEAGGKRGRSPMADDEGGWRRWEAEAGDGGIPDSRGAKRERSGQTRRKPVRERGKERQRRKHRALFCCWVVGGALR